VCFTRCFARQKSHTQSVRMRVWCTLFWMSAEPHLKCSHTHNVLEYTTVIFNMSEQPHSRVRIFHVFIYIHIYTHIHIYTLVLFVHSHVYRVSESSCSAIGSKVRIFHVFIYIHTCTHIHIYSYTHMFSIVHSHVYRVWEQSCWASQKIQLQEVRIQHILGVYNLFRTFTKHIEGVEICPYSGIPE